MSPVYLDSSIIIYLLEGAPELRALVKHKLEPFINKKCEFVTSELSWLECMVKPMKENDQPLQSRYKELFKPDYIELIPIRIQTLQKAAELRSQSALKTPDAIHIATALLTNCSTIITGDKRWKSIAELTIDIL